MCGVLVVRIPVVRFLMQISQNAWEWRTKNALIKNLEKKKKTHQTKGYKIPRLLTAVFFLNFSNDSFTAVCFQSCVLEDCPVFLKCFPDVDILVGCVVCPEKLAQKKLEECPCFKWAKMRLQFSLDNRL